MSQRRAFTLIEIMVVISIMTLLLLVSVPSLVSYQKNTKLSSEARLMAGNIRLAQQYAITEQVIYNFKLFPGEAGNYYQIINSANNEVIMSVTLNPEVHISQITDLPDNTIQFTATGGVIETGTIYLANTNNQTSTIQIKPSGYVDLTQ